MKNLKKIILYFLIDKDFDLSREEINKYFDIINADHILPSGDQ